MQTLTVIGGNLFSIAASVLGDATQWVRIAALNQLTDPFLSGQQTLRIPDAAPGAGGGVGQQ
jgi:nucleoid-associated protein YgaU